MLIQYVSCTEVALSFLCMRLVGIGLGFASRSKVPRVVKVLIAASLLLNFSHVTIRRPGLVPIADKAMRQSAYVFEIYC